MGIHDIEIPAEELAEFSRRNHIRKLSLLWVDSDDAFQSGNLSFVKGRTRQDPEVNRMLVLSLVKEIEILSEAASRVSPEIGEATGAIPWTQIIGMRHRLIHSYFDINLGVVWTTVESDLPPLVESGETAGERHLTITRCGIQCPTRFSAEPQPSAMQQYDSSTR